MSDKFNRQCFACKQSINLFDEDLDINNLVYVDGRFYHKDCYSKTKLVKKRCYQCKKDIIYGLNKKDEGVYYDNHYYHKECFENWCNGLKKITPKRKFALENEEMYLQEYEKNMSSFLKSRLSNKKTIDDLNNDAVKQVQRIRDESNLNAYLKETYNLSTISSDIWRRLDSVYKGTYKGLDMPIPVEHLSFMWREKQYVLNKMYIRNIAKGKDFSKEGRLVYDLAVLVGQYEKYLEWLNKQKLKEVESSDKIDDVIITNNIGKQVVKNNSENIEDLSDISDEIFG